MSKNVLTPQEVIQKRINMLNVQIKDAEGKRERVVAMLEEDNIYLRELNTERLGHIEFMKEQGWTIKYNSDDKHDS